uniref:DUF3368 domain-containing protein n=1 Tax=Ammonifex degensii TaxID=42838 RepID=A0A7C2E2X9_9THEO
MGCSTPPSQVVSDTTVLIALAGIDCLWLLPKLWGTVMIPEAVANEALQGSRGRQQISDAIAAGWIAVRKISDHQTVSALRGLLRGPGETECVVLAREIDAKLLLTDDKKARRLAKQNKLEVVGTLGLVVQAAGEQVISKEEAARLIAKLRETNFRATEAVFNRAISLIKQITGSSR